MKKTISSKKKGSFSEETPKDPLFLKYDERAEKSYQRAIDAFFDFEKEKLEAKNPSLNASYQPDIENKIRNICQSYWHRYDYDHRVTYSDMKSDLSSVEKSARALIRAIEATDRRSQAFLNVQISHLSPRDNVKVREYVEDTKNNCLQIINVVGKLKHKNFKKQKPSSLLWACDQISKLRELITGNKFQRSWEIADGNVLPKKNKGKVFVAQDPLFVQVIVQAINPKVEVAQVRYALKSILPKQSNRDSVG